MKHQFLLVKRVLLKKQWLLHHRNRFNPLGELIKQLVGKYQPQREVLGWSHPIRTSGKGIGFVRRVADGRNPICNRKKKGTTLGVVPFFEAPNT
jgi:hypothetical protein